MVSEEFEGAKYFLNIPAFVAHDERFKSDKSIILFGEILSMLNVTGKFYMSNKQLAKRMRCTPQTINNCLNELKKLGYIETKKIYDSDTNAIKGRQIYLGRVVKQTLLGLSNPVIEGSKPDFTLIEQNKRTINRTNNTKGKQKERIPYKQIIAYLNKKTGKHFKSTTSTNQKLIRARWNEGYSLEDFYQVIDNKYQDWSGVLFSNGKHAEEYLQPSTLFGSKFDQYLNQSNQSKSEPTTGWRVAKEDDLKKGWDDELPF